MDKDGKRQESQTQIVPTRDGKKAPLKWKLSKEDKRFLRSCNIRPE